MKSKKSTALVYVPELTPEDVFTGIVNHHHDEMRRIEFAKKIRKRRSRLRLVTLTVFLLMAVCVSVVSCIAVLELLGQI